MSEEHNKDRPDNVEQPANGQGSRQSAADFDAAVAADTPINTQMSDDETGPVANDDPPAPPSVEEHAELKDRMLRTLADMENLRRRSERDAEEARKYAVTGLARDLLEVRDNLRRGLDAVPEGATEQNDYMKNLVTGIEMTERSLLTIFERYQIKAVIPERGEKFDHHRHQAMFEVPTNELPAGTVAETMQVGYVIADRLLRPALVGVAKSAPQTDAENTPSENLGQNVNTSA
ncbi:MAG: nucleotide exchange factor GrpE [Pseudomonadota bacterium]